jgi:segregation and condensation protein A
MEIKSRQLLPPEEREALELEDQGDPRADLVRELLEYRRFREAADELGELAARRALLFGRFAFAQGLGGGEAAPADPGEELREVGLYDLMACFEKLMKAILADVPRTIIYDDVSVEERIEELRLRLAEVSGPARFGELCRGASDRADAAGILSAVLEATKRKLVTILQAEPLGELYVSLRGDAPDTQFAPPPEEQPAPLSEAQMTARRGVFGDFVAADEEDDAAEFALDREGRQAIARLEQASARAEDIIRRVARHRDGPPGAEGGLPPWAQVPGEPAAPVAPGAPGQVLVRHWTDPDRRGTLVTIGGGRAAAAGIRPRRFGRTLQDPRVGPRRLLRRSLAPGAVPRRTPRGI